MGNSATATLFYGVTFPDDIDIEVDVFDRADDAASEDDCPCVFAFHCHYDDPIYYVAIKDARFEADWGDEVAIDIRQLQVTVTAAWNLAITKFCQEAGLPKSNNYGWYLVASYG